MQRRISVIVCALLLNLVSVAQRTKPRAPQPAVAQQPTEAEDRQGIEDLQKTDIEGHLALDVDKIASGWDDDIVALPPHSLPIKGAAAYRAYFETQRKALANVDVLGYEQTWNEVRLLGEYAYEWGIINERFQPAATSKELDVSYTVMRVLKRQPSGLWKIYREIWNDRGSAVSAPEAAPETPLSKPPAENPGF